MPYSELPRLSDPASATRREFSIIHGAISLILLLILFLVFMRPF